jgi:hypothetical protein
VIQKQPSPNNILVSLNARWDALAHDPPRQALETAQWCIEHAPHLAEALSQRIYANLPDSLLKALLFQRLIPKDDGRIEALDMLAGCKAAYAPDPHQQINAAVRLLKQPLKPQPRSGTAKRAAHDTFKEIFDVEPDIRPVHEPKLIRVDWEMGRLTIALSRAHQFRLWVLARDLTRSSDGSGVVSRRAVWQSVQAQRIPITKRHFNRLLLEGEGLFWFRFGKVLYLRGIQPVACILTQAAEAEGILTETNLPGNRDVLLDPSGSLEQWEGMLYAGWITGRAIKGKWDVTISRDALAALFGRDETTLRRWEETRVAHILTIRHNFAQYAQVEGEIGIGHIPAHAQPYLASINTTANTAHEIRLMWQLPNTYHAAIPTHTHNGQAAKVRKAVHSTDDPAVTKSGGQIRLYYQSPKKLKARHHSLKFRMGLLGDVHRRVYVYVGTHPASQRGVFEYTAEKHPMTHPAERETPQREWRFFAREGAAEQRYWDARRGGFMA